MEKTIIMILTTLGDVVHAVKRALITISKMGLLVKNVKIIVL